MAIVVKHVELPLLIEENYARRINYVPMNKFHLDNSAKEGVHVLA